MDSHETPHPAPIYSVFLMGAAAESSLNPRKPTLETLKSQIKKSGKESAVIVLRDNIYPSGLPPEGTPSRKRTESRLRAQLQTVEDYSGRIIFIPGNHDWVSLGVSVLKNIRRQERYIESYLNQGNTFLPNSGYPGPASISLYTSNEDSVMVFNIQLIVLDTQWWLHPHKKPFSAGIKSENSKKKRSLPM